MGPGASESLLAGRTVFWVQALAWAGLIWRARYFPLCRVRVEQSGDQTAFASQCYCLLRFPQVIAPSSYRNRRPHCPHLHNSISASLPGFVDPCTGHAYNSGTFWQVLRRSIFLQSLNGTALRNRQAESSRGISNAPISQARPTPYSMPVKTRRTDADQIGPSNLESVFKRFVTSKSLGNTSLPPTESKIV